VGVDCAQVAAPPVEGQLRLSGGSRGRLDVYHDEQWGTVCSRGFDDSDARVACRQLGYCCGVSLGSGTDPLMGLGPVWLGYVSCVGFEQRLEYCPHVGWANSTCARSEDVAIDCLDGPSCLRRSVHVYSPGDTGLRIYVSGVTSVTPEAVQRSEAQGFFISCGTGCSKDSSAYLATSCEMAAGGPDGASTNSASLEPAGSLGLWSLTLDTSNLSLGTYFRLCLDADGNNTELSVGDAGFEVYLQVLGVDTRVVLAAPLQEVQANCSAGCNVSSTPLQVFLSIANFGCRAPLDEAQPAPVKRTHVAELSAASSTDSLWRFVVDASGLEAGARAVLCEDFDGPGPGRPGLAAGRYVYVSGTVVATSETLRRRPLQEVKLECTVGCSAVSLGFLATSCEDPTFGRSTAPANFQGVKPFFSVTLDATRLEAGFRYLLCVDLDGPDSVSARLQSGPSVGIGPFVAGVAASLTPSVLALPDQHVALTCSADCRGFSAGVSSIFLSYEPCATQTEPGTYS
ncbi:unnamed protein product, partial [Polarella glacialis]